MNENLRNREKELKEILSIITPKPRIFGRNYSYKCFEISRNNEINYGGQYYYKEKPLEFIHFTTLQGLENILRSKKLRLFDLQSMDDKEEFKVTTEFLEKELHNETLTEIKSNLFCLSMCERKVESEETSLGLWRCYGDNGNGVGLVLSFDPKGYKTWERYMLSRVFYDDASYDKLKAVIKKYTDYEANNDWTIRDFYRNLYRYFAFHKRNIYRDEREVRVLYNNNLSTNEREQTEVNWGLKRSGKICRFVELDLEWKWSAEDIKFIRKQGASPVSVVPHIRIEEIIFGYRITKDQGWDIAEVLEKMMAKLKYRPIIKESSLSKYF